MSRRDLPFAIAYSAVAGVAVLLPMALWSLNSPLVANSYGHEHAIFELFGFTASVAALLIATVQWKREPTRSPGDMVFVLVPLLVNFFFLTLITEYSHRSWDYNCYESAARALLAGANPYEQSCYLYPPLLAQLLGLGYRLISWGTSLVGSTGVLEVRVWFFLFYLFQCMQLVMVNLVLLLGFRFARRLQIPKLEALILVATLLIFNNPVFRTVRHNQVNFYLVSLILLSTLSMISHPFISGVLVALGAHLKVYPLLIGIPALLVRSWKTLLGIVVGIAAVALVQTSFGRDWEVWQQFAAWFDAFPRGVAFRDNSLHSVLFNSIKFGLHGAALPADRIAATASAAATGATVIVLAWFGVRFWQREQAYSLYGGKPDSPRGSLDAPFFRVSGHIVDCTALMLLISPMVWEHHYVIALPLAIWAVAMQGPSRPWPVAIALILMFAVPTFDFFPFSYHRLVGLILLLLVATPRQIMPIPARPAESSPAPV